MQRARDTIRRLRDNQDGFTLPETVISVLINGLCATVIAGAIVSFLAVQNNVKFSTEASSEATLAASAWRADVEDASAIAATDANQVTFTAPNGDGTCRVATWAITAKGPADTVTRSITNYPTTDPSTETCTGSPAPTIVKTVIAYATGGPAITYMNGAGRGVTFSDGAPALAATTQPPGVSNTAWGGTAIGGAQLALISSSNIGYPTNLYISQVATSLLQLAAAPSSSGTSDAGGSVHAS